MSKVRRQHYLNACKVKTSADSSLQCHSNLRQRADRQKIQMNALFLPGISKKELMKRCAVWELLTFGNLGLFRLVEGHRLRLAQTESNCWWRVCAAAPDGVLCRCHCDTRNPITLFKNSPPVTLCLNFNQLFRSVSIRVLPGVQHRSLKVNF